jgi:hypothetical protein
MRIARPLLLCLAAAACGGSADRPGVGCGIAAMATPGSVLAQFGVPQQTLSRPPASLPARLVARVAGGGTLPAIVGRTTTADSALLIGVEGQPEGEMALGYGVLLVNKSGVARGVMLFEGLPVEGAPTIGTVSMGTSSAPLIGVEADPGAYEDPACPIFPDSTLR